MLFTRDLPKTFSNIMTKCQGWIKIDDSQNQSWVPYVYVRKVNFKVNSTGGAWEDDGVGEP